MLFPRRRGSTAIEVGLVMTLLACGLLVAYARLGGGTRTAFSRLTQDGLGSPQAAIAVANTAERPLAIADAREQEIREETPIAAIVLSLAAVAGYLGFVGMMAVRKRRPKPVDDDSPQQPVAKISELPEALFAKRQDLLLLFEQVLPGGAGNSATVDLVMSPRLTSVSAQATVDEVRSIMKEERLRHLLVCDRRGNLLGVISDRDLVKPGQTAEKIMTQSPATVSRQTPLISAVTMLINRRFSSLPVVEEGKPVGILTTTDILLAMQAMVMLLQRK